MSRIYSKYFNGDLVICPMENEGTDVYIYINKLGSNEEVLYI
jgi:pyruvate dehydrogenase kinase 2/3/4